MKQKWKTSVNELFEIFRGTLLSIIPWIEKAKINWKDEMSYDDWDNIAESLYNNIVLASLTGEVTSEYSIARYNFKYDDYSFLDYIEVKNADNSSNQFVFVAFQSKFEPFDHVKLAEVDKDNKVVGYSNLKCIGLDFAFVKNNGGKKQVIKNVEVES